MNRPRLLDLFCGAGGAAMGYHRAGFDVVGVDINPQPHYPFEFHQADATELLTLSRDYDTNAVGTWDAIHASPPCQAYSTLGKQNGNEYPELYESVRDGLVAIGVPWVIENVIGAPYRSGTVLCGSMFGLRVRRHRNFETSFMIFGPPICDHATQGTPLGVYGNGGGGVMTRGVKATPAEARIAMGIDWMSHREISQAIPPAYTEWIGRRLLDELQTATGTTQEPSTKALT